MKAVLTLFHGLFDILFSIPLFDTGVSFGHFVVAILMFDVGLIILRHVLRNDDGDNSNSTALMKRR